MRLEDLTIALRPRGPWEAVDLGCSLARRDFGRLLSLWAVTVFPLWIILAAVLWREPYLFSLVVWWLKPLYDRIPLYYMSRAAFGSRPTFAETLREWPRLWSGFLLRSLVWRRISMIRSFALPVWMLEGQRGRAASRRAVALGSGGSSGAVMATLTFMTFEFGVFMGLWALTAFLQPDTGLPEMADLFDLMGTDPESITFAPEFTWYLNVLYLAAITLVEIFYVGAGFGLYLNTRIKLEGWDIELTFRRLATRLRAASVVGAVALTGCLILAGTAARAQDPSPKQAQAQAPSRTDPAAKTIDEILKQPEFKIHDRIQKVPDVEGNAKFVPPDWLAGLAGLAAWAVAAVILALAIWWLISNRHLFGLSERRLPQAKPAPARVVMGMEITRASLPTDLIASALAAWAEGRHREALSLLFRGALSRLVEQHRLPIRDSDTEDDCLAHVERTGFGEQTRYFRTLTRLWMRAAYAGMEATADEFNELCATWPFESARTLPTKTSLIRGAAPVALALAALVLSGCKFKDVVIPIGYKGAARSDPFLAARRLLEKFGHDAEKARVMRSLPAPEDSVLVLSGEGGMAEGRARQLLNWADSGGHLIYALAGCRTYNDWSVSSGGGTYAYFGNQDREDSLLKHLGVAINDDRRSAAEQRAEEAKARKKAQADKKEAAPEKPESLAEKIATPEDVPTRSETLKWADQSFELVMPDHVTLGLSRPLRRGDYAAGHENQHTLLSLRHGSGRITLLNHARPLRNRYIGDKDHAAALLALIGPEWKDVRFVMTVEASLWSLLWRHGWMIIIGLAALVVFWLWRHVRRFGPVQRVELHETRHFVDHIGALGQFFHSLRRDDVLITAAVEEVRARAAARYPQLVGAADSALIPLLAQRSGLSEERVTTALASQGGRNQHHHLVRLLHDLQTLRSSLE